MKKIIIEPHYFGCIEYFSLLFKYDQIIFEVCDSFPKQTFRNRAHVLGANNIQNMIVPVSYRNHTYTKDVRIDHSQRWAKEHCRTFHTCYGSAPYYEYFSEELDKIWNAQYRFLIDLTMASFILVLKILKKNVHYILSASYQKNYPLDYRNTIIPKKLYKKTKIFTSKVYNQLFGDSFVPNLSIIDLLLCEGIHSIQKLK